MVEFELNLDWSRVGWVGFGGVLGVAVLYIVQSFVGTVVFGLFIYYATRRLYYIIRARLGQPTIAAVLSLLVLALPAVLLLYYTLAIALQELTRFASTTDFGPYLQFTDQFANVSSVVENPRTLLSDPNAVGIIRSTLNQAANYLGFIANGLLHLFVMFAIAFYLLRDAPRLARWAGEFGDEYGILESYVRAVDDSLEKIFAGNILNALVTGVIGAITYSLLQGFAPSALSIPYPALVGLLAGIASLIPIVGMKLVYVPLVGYLSVLAYSEGTGWGFVGLFAIVSLIVVDAIPDFMVRPYVSGGDLHVGLLMLAYIFGPLLFGWPGIFLGPIVLVLLTHFVTLVLPELLAGKSIRPVAVDPSHATAPAGEPDGPLSQAASHRESGESGSETGGGSGASGGEGAPGPGDESGDD